MQGSRFRREEEYCRTQRGDCDAGEHRRHPARGEGRQTPGDPTPHPKFPELRSGVTHTLALPAFPGGHWAPSLLPETSQMKQKHRPPRWFLTQRLPRPPCHRRPPAQLCTRLSPSDPHQLPWFGYSVLLPQSPSCPSLVPQCGGGGGDGSLRGGA